MISRYGHFFTRIAIYHPPFKHTKKGKFCKCSVFLLLKLWRRVLRCIPQLLLIHCRDPKENKTWMEPRISYVLLRWRVAFPVLGLTAILSQRNLVERNKNCEAYRLHNRASNAKLHTAQHRRDTHTHAHAYPEQLTSGVSLAILFCSERKSKTFVATWPVSTQWRVDCHLSSGGNPLFFFFVH